MTLTIDQFKKGWIKTPWPLRADSYTISSNDFASPQCREFSCYNYTNRRSPKDAESFMGVAQDSRMIFDGLSTFIQHNMTDKFSMDCIDKSDLFMDDRNSFGGRLNFDRKLWEDALKEFGGYLPILIEALPEGSTFFPHEPVVQVYSLGDKYGEIAAHVEALLVGSVSIASCTATLMRHWLQHLREVVKEENPDYNQTQIDAVARWLVHDFMMRACSGLDDGELRGMSRLLSFNGTDTFSAAYQAHMRGAKAPIGTSILALAHRIVQGYNTEEEAYRAIHKAAGGSNGAASYVGDCYGYENAVNNIIFPLVKSLGGTAIARPDSRDQVENVMFTCRTAMKMGLYDVDRQGKFIATQGRFINGDSINPEIYRNIIQALRGENFNATGWGGVGVGGYVVRACTRDTLSSAYKLSAKGKDLKPVVKLGGSRAKLSVPGPNNLVRSFNPNQPSTFVEDPIYRKHGGNSSYKTYYSGGEFGEQCVESFQVRSERCINQFDQLEHFPAKYNNLAHEVISIQDQVMKSHGANFD